MAVNPLYYDFADAETVKGWEKGFDVEVRMRAPKFDPAYGLAGKKDTTPFIIKDDLAKSAGDRLRTTLRLQLSASNRMKKGREIAEGAALGFETRTWDIELDQVRQNIGLDGRMAQQRVHADLAEHAKGALADYLADYMEYAGSAHLAGWNVITDTVYTFNNAPAAPDALHILRINDRANDQSLVAGDSLDLLTINKAIAMCKAGVPRIRPADILGRKLFVMLLHTHVVTKMRETSSDFFLIHLKAMTGGKVDDNPIITGALGVYNGVLFLEDQSVAPGLHSTAGTPVANTRRNTLLGAGALHLIYGRTKVGGGFALNRWLWYVDEEDGGDKTVFYASTIGGMGCPRFTINGTARDFAKIVISSYAEDVTTQEAFWTDVLAA